MRYNIFLLLDVGTFSALVELLNMEIEYVLIQSPRMYLIREKICFSVARFTQQNKNVRVGIARLHINAFILPFSNSAACSSAVRKPAISLADSTDLRVLLNIMYLMVETIQQDDPADKPEWKIIRETFRAELGKCHQC